MSRFVRGSFTREGLKINKNTPDEEEDFLRNLKNIVEKIENGQKSSSDIAFNTDFLKQIIANEESREDDFIELLSNYLPYPEKQPKPDRFPTNFPTNPYSKANNEGSSREAAQRILNKLQYNKQIENYLGLNWDFIKNKVYDIRLSSDGNIVHPEQVTDLNVIWRRTKEDRTLEQSMSGYKNLQYIRKNIPVVYSHTTNNKGHSTADIFIFIGTPEQAFLNVMKRKASFIDWIPKVSKEGKLIGNVNLATILKVTLNYDRIYGQYLKELYDAQNIDGYVK